MTALTNMGQHHNKSTEIVLNWGIMTGLPICVDRQHFASAPNPRREGCLSVPVETEAAIIAVVWVPDGSFS